MRFCPYCHRWNPGEPIRCRYCGRTWGVRLCPAGHENPTDAVHCGECGRVNMSDSSGPMPVIFRLVALVKPALKVILVAAVVLVVVGVLRETNWVALSSFIIPVTLLLLVHKSITRSLHIDILKSITRLLSNLIRRHGS